MRNNMDLYNIKILLLGLTDEKLEDILKRVPFIKSQTEIEEKILWM